MKSYTPLNYSSHLPEGRKRARYNISIDDFVYSQARQYGITNLSRFVENSLAKYVSLERDKQDNWKKKCGNCGFEWKPAQTGSAICPNCKRYEGTS